MPWEDLLIDCFVHFDTAPLIFLEHLSVLSISLTHAMDQSMYIYFPSHLWFSICVPDFP